MKLQKLVIKNFRGIKDTAVYLEDYALLVGANNSGKTTVIDALRIFYEKDKYKFVPSRDRPAAANGDQPSWIELTYSLTADEHNSLPDKYKQGNNTLWVRKHLFGPDDRGRKPGIIYGYETNGVLSEEQFHGTVQAGKFGTLVYIPAVSKVDDHIKLSGPSALRDLLNDVMADVLESCEEFSQFQNATTSLSVAMKTEQTDDGRSLEGLEKELNARLKPWGADFSLNLSPPKPQEIIKSMVEVDLRDLEVKESRPIELFGSGFQRHFIYSLIEIQSQFTPPRKQSKKKEFSPDLTLILFEEPEAFLHPPQQETLARGLRQISSTEGKQVVCSTHSSHFVSRNSDSIPSIIRLRRDGGVISAYQIATDKWADIASENQKINQILLKYPRRKPADDDLQADMEAVKHCLWLNAERSSMFFANKVLLVEGPTETSLIGRLISEGMIEVPDGGLYLLDSLGKYNIHRFMNLLGHLGITHAVLFDSDDDKDEHAEINKLIRSSANRFTLSVHEINGELESLLKVSKAKQPHRKPQHMMYQYESKAIAPEDIEVLCGIIRGCLQVQT